MSLSFEYSLFPPKFHCIMSSRTSTPNNNNDPLFLCGDLKFDTGADITCISANRLNLYTTEEEFTSWIQTHNNIEIIKQGNLKRNGIVVTKSKGIDKEAEDIKAYAYQLEDFTIESADGSISLGSVPVFITFDKRFQTPLLGRDLLSLLNIEIDNDSNMMNISSTEKLKNNKITPQFFINQGIYNNRNMVIEENALL